MRKEGALGDRQIARGLGETQGGQPSAIAAQTGCDPMARLAGRDVDAGAVLRAAAQATGAH